MVDSGVGSDGSSRCRPWAREPGLAGRHQGAWRRPADRWLRPRVAAPAFFPGPGFRSRVAQESKRREVASFAFRRGGWPTACQPSVRCSAPPRPSAYQTHEADQGGGKPAGFRAGGRSAASFFPGSRAGERSDHGCGEMENRTMYEGAPIWRRNRGQVGAKRGVRRAGLSGLGDGRGGPDVESGGSGGRAASGGPCLGPDDGDTAAVGARRSCRARTFFRSPGRRPALVK